MIPPMTSNAGGRAEMYSLVIPVYLNEGSLDRLLDELIKLGSRVSGELEVVFVVDGSRTGRWRFFGSGFRGFRWRRNWFRSAAASGRLPPSPRG